MRVLMPLARSIVVLLLAGGCAAVCAQTAPAPPPPQPVCDAPEHRQFDFWVGRWNVYPTGADTLVAHSLVEQLYDGCVIREHWMPLQGRAGGSVNTFESGEHRWVQTWVSGAGARVEFRGGHVGERMVMTGFWRDIGGPGKHGLVRMSFSPTGDGAVRQVGELSTDHGITWTPSFDLTYRPAATDPE